jgi:hypothetical protein
MTAAFCQGHVGKASDEILCSYPVVAVVRKDCTCKNQDTAQCSDGERRPTRMAVCAQHLAQAVKAVAFDCYHADHETVLVRLVTHA